MVRENSVDLGAGIQEPSFLLQRLPWIKAKASVRPNPVRELPGLGGSALNWKWELWELEVTD